MPIYTYHCTRCGEDEDVFAKIDERDKPRPHSCGLSMIRLMTIPQPPIMKKTGSDMALNTLNSKGHDSLPNKYGGNSRMEKLVAAGLEEPPKQFF